MMQFKDRTEAGQLLAKQLFSAYANRSDVLVKALPRGGVPVAYEVAKALNAPLDVFVVQKLGVPGCEDLAMGATASGGFRVINDDIVRSHHIPYPVIDRAAKTASRQLWRREHLYRGNMGFSECDPTPLDVFDATVIVVDDGIATGATMRAAIIALRQQQPARIIIAVPVAPAIAYAELRTEVDDVFCLLTPVHIYGLSGWYDLFPPVSDQQVQHLLALASLESCSIAQTGLK